MKEELFRNYRELQSERLLLREITARDVSDIFEIYSDPEVMLYFDDRFAFQDLSEAEQMISGLSSLIPERPEKPARSVRERCRRIGLAKRGKCDIISLRHRKGGLP